uniref:Uncharacterized protein n=1 Tax=Anopheles stephensi TaxID=30069 RepID=A0A182YPY4_ANOST
MQVMIFGATCSPIYAKYVKNQNALKYNQEFPNAAEAICRNHYVDDYLDSLTTAEAKKLVESVAIMLKYKEFLISNVNQMPFSNTLCKTVLDKAEKILILNAQWESFNEECTRLSLNRPIPPKSSIKTLTPTLLHGLLRIQGRLENVGYIDLYASQPIILPKETQHNQPYNRALPRKILS